MSALRDLLLRTVWKSTAEVAALDIAAPLECTLNSGSYPVSDPEESCNRHQTRADMRASTEVDLAQLKIVGLTEQRPGRDLESLWNLFSCTPSYFPTGKHLGDRQDVSMRSCRSRGLPRPDSGPLTASVFPLNPARGE